MSLALSDPRTIARNIPGVLDGAFPMLTPIIAGHFNRTAVRYKNAIGRELLAQTTLASSMLFELALVVGTKTLFGESIDWDECLLVAVARQRLFFDAKIPSQLTNADKVVASQVGDNLIEIISLKRTAFDGVLICSPIVRGYHWIASGHADFCWGSTLVEVKCGARPFSVADYRQIIMYWLLGFAASIEMKEAEWRTAILINPRLAISVQFDFDDFLHTVSGGRSKVEILQIFQNTIEANERGFERIF